MRYRPGSPIVRSGKYIYARSLLLLVELLAVASGNGWVESAILPLS